MLLVIIAGVGSIVLFAFGVAIGLRLAELNLASRSRRQAAVQRDLNERARLLRRMEEQLNLLAP